MSVPNIYEARHDNQLDVCMYRSCPLSYSEEDRSTERKLKHEILKAQTTKITSYPRVTVPVVVHVVQSFDSTRVQDGYIRSASCWPNDLSDLTLRLALHR